MKITGDTITDEQIVELLRETERLCNVATGDDGSDLPEDHLIRRKARARCAELLNARNAK